MAPPQTQTALARPPFAVDDKDTQYQQNDGQQPRRTRTKEERNKASESTYNAYDNYLEPGSRQPNTTLHVQSKSRDERDSAHGAIGGGLLSALDDSDYSSDDSDDDDPRIKIATATTKPLTITKDAVKSKNQALFEAATMEDRLPSPSALSPGGGSSTTSRGPSPGPPSYEEVNGRRTPVDEKKKVNGSAAFGVSNPTSERDPDSRRQQQSQQRLSPNNNNLVNAANAVETGGRRGPSPSITPPPAAPLQVHIPAHQMNAPQPQRPILNQSNPTHVSPISPQAQQQQYNPRGPPPPQQGLPRGPPQALTVNTRNIGPPPHHAPFAPAPGSMQPFGFHMTPTPTPADFASSPIVPAFIQPNKPIRAAFIHFDKNTENSEKSPSAMSHESTMPIMRGEKEDYLPLRSGGPGVGPRAPRVGEKHHGDDFWRRFSMVAKMDKAVANKGGDKQSAWLNSALGNTSALRAWTWCVGLFMLAIVVGGIVAIWWFTRSNPAHAIPVAIGGGASETMLSSSTEPTPVATANVDSIPTTTGKAAASTTTKAKAKRALGDFVLPVQTPAAVSAEKRMAHKRHQGGRAQQTLMR
ncbi:hypothetical protein FRB98_006702 [Tulasnella sp. 332]|nr:hypothetical protein FRB98_006702 [Tulasnella sp. 332]